MNKTIANFGHLPKPLIGIKKWAQQITMRVIKQEIVEGDIINYERMIRFNGCVQPLDEEAIKLKPEGQRSWEWWQIHTPLGVVLQTNDRIVYNKEEYKVMARRNYFAYGYIEYHAIKDYQDNVENAGEVHC